MPNMFEVFVEQDRIREQKDEQERRLRASSPNPAARQEMISADSYIQGEPDELGELNIERANDFSGHASVDVLGSIAAQVTLDFFEYIRSLPSADDTTGSTYIGGDNRGYPIAYSYLPARFQTENQSRNTPEQPLENVFICNDGRIRMKNGGLLPAVNLGGLFAPPVFGHWECEVTPGRSGDFKLVGDSTTLVYTSKSIPSRSDYTFRTTADYAAGITNVLQYYALEISRSKTPYLASLRPKVIIKEKTT